MSERRGSVMLNKARIEVEQTCYMNASPESVYAIIADYRNGHPRILPAKYFGPLIVESGGVGAGTRIRFTMKGLGPTHVVVADIDEPVPGHVLRETVPAKGAVTTFTVEALRLGCHVAINTTWTSSGLLGVVERVLAPRFLRKVYAEELELLKVLVEGRSHK